METKTRPVTSMKSIIPCSVSQRPFFSSLKLNSGDRNAGVECIQLRDRRISHFITSGFVYLSI